MRSARRTILRLAAAVGLCFALGACGKPAPPPPGGATSSKAELARREAESLAVGAVNGGANAQGEALPELVVNRTWKDRALGKAVLPKGGKPPAPVAPAEASAGKGPPAPKAPPRPGIGPLAVRECVPSPVPDVEAEADRAAVARACEVVEEKLAALDPPVRRRVAPSELRAEFLRADSRTVRPPDDAEKEIYAELDGHQNLVYVQYDVEVTADQVREMRAQERVAGALRVLGALVAVALAGLLFLRADEWTRGYLTSWLALGAALLAGGAAAALIFI
ncbi:MAG: hypothetical protein ACKODX_05380 [Gemmata sp.]